MQSMDSGFLQEIRQVQAHAECLLNYEAVMQGIAVLAKKMSPPLADKNPLCLCMMNGGLMFTAALMQHFVFPLQLDYLHLSRYRGGLSGRDVQWLGKPVTPLANRVVVLLDDILDEGISLQAAKDYCAQQGAAKVLTAVLIKKRLANGKQQGDADFFAFECDDRYLFGFGMDYKNYLRNAPGIYALNEVKKT